MTLHCTSNVSNSYLYWYDSLCVTTTRSPGDCTADFIYNGFNIAHKLIPRVQVTAVNNATHVTRDFNFNSVQLTDAGVYLCLEARRGVMKVAQLDYSSSQIIILGNFNAIFTKSFLTFELLSHYNSHFTKTCL